MSEVAKKAARRPPRKSAPATGAQLPLRQVLPPDVPPSTPPRHRQSLQAVGLFAGVGGIEFGLHSAGHRTLLLCENDPGASEVLKVRFPNTPQHQDVRTLSALPKEVDLVAAGFPCQDLSQAGSTRGISGSRSGLVGEVFRLLEQRRVDWVLLENVPFMLQLASGHALDVIVSQLERLGYAWAYRTVDTRAFGLPQRRERVFLLATNQGDPRTVLFADDAGEPALPEYRSGAAFGFYWTEGVRGLGAAVDAVPTLKGGSTIGIPSPPAILMPNGDVVKPDIRDAERLQGFPADWTQPACSIVKPGHRWKLVGNSVTVDVARWIGERLAVPGVYDGSWDARILPGAPWPRSAWNLGEGRYTAQLSTWPFQRPIIRLAEFLQYPTTPLSSKATAGFLTRAGRGSLRFPTGFLAAIQTHLSRMEASNAGEPPRRANRDKRARTDRTTASATSIQA
ncbi:DNA (cytosine-5-)-methyltransferase [bacterium]|nr:DNA (cytosine-5-)-methyltransferase [bacterium]